MLTGEGQAVDFKFKFSHLQTTQDDTRFSAPVFAEVLHGVSFKPSLRALERRQDQAHLVQMGRWGWMGFSGG